MIRDRLDLQAERAARNQCLARAVNEEIHGASASLVALDVREYLWCECGDLGCSERVAVPYDEYRRIRGDGAKFIVAPGHERLHLEEVVDRDSGWIVVRKLGVGAKVAADLVWAR